MPTIKGGIKLGIGASEEDKKKLQDVLRKEVFKDPVGLKFMGVVSESPKPIIIESVKPSKKKKDKV